MNLFDIAKLRAFTFSGITTVVRLMTGFLSVKILAVFLGPEGIAIIGNFNNTIAIVTTLSSFGIGAGVIKYLSQSQSLGDDNTPNLISTAFYTLLWSSLVVALVLLVGGYFLAQKILLSSDFWYVFVILAFTLFCNTFNLFLQNICNSFQNYKHLALINVVNGLFTLVVAFISIYLFHLKGALLSIVIIQVTSLAVTMWFIKGEEWFVRSNFLGKFDYKIFSNYSKYTLMAVVSIICVPVVQMVVRKAIIDTNSLNDAGMWEALNRLSSSYLMIITSTFSIYYLPKFSSITDGMQLRLEIRNAFLLILPTLLLGQLGIFFLGTPIIHILFTAQFYPIIDYLAFQLVGDFFKVASLILAYVLVARAQSKMFIVGEIASGLLFFIAAYFLIPLFGVKGAVWAYVIDSIFYFVLMIFMTQRLFCQLKISSQ